MHGSVTAGIVGESGRGVYGNGSDSAWQATRGRTGEDGNVKAGLMRIVRSVKLASIGQGRRGEQRCELVGIGADRLGRQVQHRIGRSRDDGAWQARMGLDKQGWDRRGWRGGPEKGREA